MQPGHTNIVQSVGDDPVRPKRECGLISNRYVSGAGGDDKHPRLGFAHIGCSIQHTASRHIGGEPFVVHGSHRLHLCLVRTREQHRA